MKQKKVNKTDSSQKDDSRNEYLLNHKESRNIRSSNILLEFTL